MAAISSIGLYSDTSLVAYYKFDSSGLTTDSKGSYTLTNNNGVTQSPGKYGQCADFGSSNTNKYLSVPNNMGITNGAITLCGWVLLNGQVPTNGEWAFFSHGDSGTNVVYYISYMNYSGFEIRFRRWRAGVGISDVVYATNMNDGFWHFVCLTYDGSTLTGYFDGNAIGTTSASGNGTGGVSSSFHSVGCSFGSGGVPSFFASSLIEDHGVFSRALTATEVKSIFLEKSSAAMLFFV